MTACTVFTGPTLPRAEVAALLPHARILPPVRHGDLLRLDARAGDTVLIIDGLFLQTASVRHREIMYLLQRGVTVAGSSSMGALRAAELWRFGMRGYGEVFRLYRDGEIDGDDEVAVVHGTAEDGYRAFSDPLVSIRVALRDAVGAGVISPAEAALMLAETVATPFRSRSFRALEARAPAGPAQRFRAWRSARDTDLKAADARLLLAAAASGDPSLCPAGVGDWPARNVHMWIFDTWEHQHHGGTVEGEWVADADAGAAIRLFHPGFRDSHREHVLSRVAGLDPDHPAVAERAVAVARARGLLPAVPGGWITERDLAGPADEVLATLLVRAFGIVRRWPPGRWDLPPSLRTERALAAGRAIVLAALRHDRRVGDGRGDQAGDGCGGQRQERRRSGIRPAGDAGCAIAGVWGCDPADLEPQAWDRGIPDLATLRAIAAPFAAYLRAEEAISDISAVMSVV